MRVRVARRGDLDDVSNLYMKLNPGRRRNGKLRTFKTSVDARVFVAEDDGHVVGFLWVQLVKYANTKVAYIEELFVDEDHRLRGLGSALLMQTVRWLDKARVPVVFVSTTAGDRVAQQFYQAEGFRRTRGPWFYIVPSSRRRL